MNSYSYNNNKLYYNFIIIYAKVQREYTAKSLKDIAYCARNKRLLLKCKPFTTRPCAKYQHIVHKSYFNTHCV